MRDKTLYKVLQVQDFESRLEDLYKKASGCLAPGCCQLVQRRGAAARAEVLGEDQSCLEPTEKLLI